MYDPTKSYLHKFETVSEFEEVYHSENYYAPWVSAIVENGKVAYDKPALTSITLTNIVWVSDVPASGGTATKDNCTYTVIGYYDDKSSEDITSFVTVTGTTVVEPSFNLERHSAGTLTLTASYSGFNSSDSVVIYQEAFIPTMTGITLDDLTWVMDIPASGGTATSANCTFNVTGHYDNATTEDVTALATVSGSLEVEASQMESQHSAGTLTLTATYSGFTDSDSVTVYQEASGSSITAISLDNVVWVTNIPASGGTATSANCSYSVTAYYNNSASGNITSVATVTGSTVIPEATIIGVHSAGTLTLTASYSGFNDSVTVDVYQEGAAPYEERYLTFNVISAGTILWTCDSGETTNKTIEYSTDKGQTWTSISSTSAGTPINVSAGDKVMFRGTNAQYATSKDKNSGFIGGTAKYDVEGNVMSLIGGDNFSGLTTFTKTWTFHSLFNRCGAVSAENLILPVTALTADCYRAMFANSPYLVVPPQLPATTLAKECYWFMFENCPITKAPALAAATLVQGCYGNMFTGCTNLNYIKCLATDISASDCTAGWVRSVAATGTFIKDPNMNDWTVGNSGIPVGWVTYTGLTLSSSYVLIKEAGSVETITVFSPDNWSATTAADWLTIIPSGGIEGNTSVTVSASATSESRTASVVFTDGTNSQTLTVYQTLYSQQYLTLDVISGGTIMWKSFGDASKTISYSLDNGNTWSAITSTPSGVPITVATGDKVLLKGTETRYCDGDKTKYSGFDDSHDSGTTTSGTARYNIQGNIMSLLYGDNFSGQTTLPSTWTFCHLFKFSNAVSAKNLVLPATALTECCYRAMFSWATKLVDAPELPATTLAKDCYWYMFEKAAITSIEIPATTFVQGSCGNMFISCANLNYIKCMATNISASACTFSWVSGVAATGTFVKDPSMTSWTTGKNGIPTGWIVEDANTLYEPAITCDGIDVEITCRTEGAEIFYRLNEVGTYSAYTEVFEISANTIVEAYSQYSGQTSETVSASCVYCAETPYEASNKVLSTWAFSGNQIETPYSVNRIDGHSGNYAKGTFNFETSVSLRKVQPTYLWFQHADQSATIYVDNTLVEKHWGGYAAFFVDISNYIHKGTNNIKVALKNNEGNYLAPADADFNFNATLGNVKLFTSPYLPAMNYGYDGFHVTSDVATSSATIYVKTTIPTGATVTCEIDDGTFHYGTSASSTGNEMIFSATVQNPHLWNGTLDPHLYNITMEIYADGDLYHRYQRPYGLRFYEYVINQASGEGTYTGFLLNGQPYLLRGCCMHDDIDGKANALNDADYAQTFSVIQELGANFLRLAHYPHPKETYDWCDRLGIVVQTEGPCVNKMQSTMPSDYYDHLNGQYDDMVNQHYNHPCIFFWGLSNETQTDDVPFAKEKMNGYIARIRALDSERMVGYVMSQVTNNPSGYYDDPDADWFGCNIYEGWYSNTNSNNPSTQLNTRVNTTITQRNKALAYSEYGAGGTQHCHSDNFMSTTTRGNKPRHDIEYQMWLHEGHIAAIKNYPQLMFTSEWQLFDIAVAKRNEGYTVCLDGENTSIDDNLRRLNDKGLVERDHRTKKDTFYLYKAWWNQTDKFVHICGKDYEKIEDRAIKCYTNDGNSLSMYVNGTLVETVSVTDNIAVFSARTFNGEDIILVSGDTSSDTLQVHDYLTFNIMSAGTIYWKSGDSSFTATIEYSKNSGAWTSLVPSTAGTPISVVAGDKVEFRGDNPNYGVPNNFNRYSVFSGATAIFNIKGNIMSLIDSNGYATAQTLTSGNTFKYLFRNCTGLTSAKNLKLPASTLTEYCYQGMFNGCTSLTVAPELPATTLAYACYDAMFSNCTSLTTAPELPATTLAPNCYFNMFIQCTSLTTAPELPVTTLAGYCYSSMFQGCTSLRTAPELPATKLATSCYSGMFYGCTSLTTAPKLPATTLAQSCYYNMFYNCTSLATAPSLPATTLAGSCYTYMFNGCTSLTTGPSSIGTPISTGTSACTLMFGDCTSLVVPPALPATSLSMCCYAEMFRGCTSLTAAPALPATTLNYRCYDSMFSGCTSLTIPPVLSAITLAQSCYQAMFYGCTSLTTAPELPATTLAQSCYYNMFRGCTSLNYIKCFATNISVSNCTYHWVSGVAQTGTFVKNPNMSSWTTGTGGIPTNWTVEDAT